jgi:hypothetical protein
LPWGRSIDHHKSITYAEIEEQVMVPFTVTLESDDGRTSFHVSGNCPACGGLMTKDISYGIGGSGTKGFRGPASPAAPVRATLYCECGRVHPDRPAGAADHGCGRFWRIKLTAP